MTDVRKTKTYMYSAIEKSIQSYLMEFAKQLDEQHGSLDMNDIMKEMCEMVEFTERLHLNVIMSALGTSLSNAKEMRTIPDFEEASVELVKATHVLFNQCRTDFNRNLDARLKEMLIAVDVEAIWDTGMTHNERVAKEIMESLRGEEGADDASQSAQEED